MGHKPGKHGATQGPVAAAVANNNPYIRAKMQKLGNEFDRAFHRSPVTQEHHERHERCWGCLVWCLCSGHIVAEEDKGHERHIVSHLALLTADYFRAAPSCFAWVRGLRRIKRETKAEDEANFVQHAPEPASWPAEHFVLDLGVAPPGAGGGPPPPLPEVARLAAHFSAFATAAYALKLQLLVDPGRACLNLPRCRLPSAARAFCEMAGVPEADVIYAQTDARPFKPSWWLCLDRASRAVVVAVRGTFGPGDLLSDALARQVHHNERVLHEGVLASAQWILAELRPRLPGLEQLRSGDYRLVIVGHSLGGAVAAIAAWLLRTEDGVGGRYAAQAFTYGAPLVVDQPLARHMEGFVVGVVHHCDLIPRLGHKSLMDLRDRVVELTASAEQRLARLEAVLAEFALPPRPEALRETLAEWQPRMVRASSGPWEDAAEDVWELPAFEMCNPGWQIHLQRRGLRCRLLELMPVLFGCVTRGLLITARTPSHAYMQAIRPCLTMWTDHWPQGYQYVCEAFADRLEAKRRPGERTDLPTALRGLAAYLEEAAGGAADV